ncbi:hypothetical protein BD324DRAFT_649819 [Kockovaella imperatae]|uniref:Uncharacterized protein n=1 Tax=Kockovaella imperatae TaxID=4999 RepID=A0A1Y1UKE6_9TREE|nr:hypothetical protein BD324DRAFT_649819 [Kockovaella imperatae]ORX38452.1 hypothetical protein BD324DRAFT_649819 [Kockovaella imperatae]
MTSDVFKTLPQIPMDASMAQSTQERSTPSSSSATPSYRQDEFFSMHDLEMKLRESQGNVQRARKALRRKSPPRYDFTPASPSDHSSVGSQPQTPALDLSTHFEYPSLPSETASYVDSDRDSWSLSHLPHDQGLGYAASKSLPHIDDNTFDTQRPTWCSEVNSFGRIPSMESVMSDPAFLLPCQFMCDLSCPETMEQLTKLRQAAANLEACLQRVSALPLASEADVSISMSAPTRPVVRRIRRKAVPTPYDDSTISHSISITPAPFVPTTPTRIAPAVPKRSPVRPAPRKSSLISASSTQPVAKRSALASMYQNSRASQSVSELTSRVSAWSPFGSRSTNRPAISSPMRRTSCDTQSTHSDILDSGSSSSGTSFSATYAKTSTESLALARYTTPTKPSVSPRTSSMTPGLSQFADAQFGYHQASSGSSLSTHMPAGQGNQNPHGPLSEAESGLKKLGMGLSRGMSSVLNLGSLDRGSSLSAIENKERPLRTHFRLRRSDLSSRAANDLSRSSPMGEEEAQIQPSKVKRRILSMPRVFSSR